MLKKLAFVILASTSLLGSFQAANAGLTAVGPARSATGNFPVWYEDANGLKLELCLSGPNCTLLPTAAFDPTSPVVFQSNFPDESFWFTADAVLNQGGVNLRYVAALEAAFASGNVVDGEQISFARIRIRATVPTAGTYIITHPYGVETIENVTVANGINFTRDIGIGPDFTGPLAGNIGPFLQGVNPPPPTGSVGWPNFVQTVSGSPFATNLVRVQGPGGINGQTTLFKLSGKIFSGVLPPDLSVPRATYSRSAAQVPHIDLFATSSDATAVSFDSTTGGTITMNTDSAGQFYGSEPNPTTIPAITLVTADSAAGSVTVSSSIVDIVKISKAVYSLADLTLVVDAASSDETLPLPTLTANGIGDLVPGAGTTQQLEVIGLAQPPARVTVTSSFGGSDTEPVKVLASFNQAPVANAGADQTLTLGVNQSTLTATLDGTLSSDIDGSIASYRWSGTPTPAGSATPTVSLGVGTHLFTLSVTDDSGAPSAMADTVSITVAAPVACSLGVIPGSAPEVASTLVAVRRAGRSRYLYDQTYSVDLLAFNGGPVSGVTATVTTTDGSITLLDNALSFDVLPGSSSDTFTLRRDRRLPLDLGSLQFSLEGHGAACE